MIRWITHNLGTGAYESVVAANDLKIVDVRDLVDKSGNLPALARSKIDEAIGQLRAGFKVVVCCDYGMSRSNAVAAGVLAASGSFSFSEAVRQVRQATGEGAIRIEVLDAVRAAIEHTPAKKAAPGSPRILITGGTGFVGQALLRRFPAEYQVFAPGRSQVDLVGGVVDLDLMVKDQGVEIVIHLATPRIYTSNQSLGEMLVLMKNVLDVCLQNQTKLIYISSWEVYSGYRSEGLMASEDLPRNPWGTYGHSKSLCEDLLDRYHSRTGLDYTLLRGCPIYGEAGDKPKFILNFLRKALRDETIVAHRYLNGFPCLDLLYIDDLVDAILAVVPRDSSGAYNVGSGHAVSTTRIAEMIIELTGSRSVIEHREIQEYAPNVVMDSTKARETLRWAPRVAIEEGLRKIVESKRHGADPSVESR